MPRSGSATRSKSAWKSDRLRFRLQTHSGAYRRQASKAPRILTMRGFADYAESENRTRDTRFFRPVLYRLSYLGVLGRWDLRAYSPW